MNINQTSALSSITGEGLSIQAASAGISNSDNETSSPFHPTGSGYVDDLELFLNSEDFEWEVLFFSENGTINGDQVPYSTSSQLKTALFIIDIVANLLLLVILFVPLARCQTFIRLLKHCLLAPIVNSACRLLLRHHHRRQTSCSSFNKNNNNAPINLSIGNKMLIRSSSLGVGSNNRRQAEAAMLLNHQSSNKASADEQVLSWDAAAGHRHYPLTPTYSSPVPATQTVINTRYYNNNNSITAVNRRSSPRISNNQLRHGQRPKIFLQRCFIASLAIANMIAGFGVFTRIILPHFGLPFLCNELPVTACLKIAHLQIMASLCGCSVDHYLAVLHPLLHRTRASLLSSSYLIATLAMWLTAIVFVVSDFTIPAVWPKPSCTLAQFGSASSWSLRYYCSAVVCNHSYVLEGIQFLLMIPFVLTILLCYVRLFIFLIRNYRRRQRHQSANKRQQQRDHQRTSSSQLPPSNICSVILANNYTNQQHQQLSATSSIDTKSSNLAAVSSEQSKSRLLLSTKAIRAPLASLDDDDLVFVDDDVSTACGYNISGCMSPLVGKMKQNPSSLRRYRQLSFRDECDGCDSKNNNNCRLSTATTIATTISPSDNISLSTFNSLPATGANTLPGDRNSANSYKNRNSTTTISSSASTCLDYLSDNNNDRNSSGKPAIKATRNENGESVNSKKLKRKPSSSASGSSLSLVPSLKGVFLTALIILSCTFAWMPHMVVEVLAPHLTWLLSNDDNISFFDNTQKFTEIALLVYCCTTPLIYGGNLLFKSNANPSRGLAINSLFAVSKRSRYISENAANTAANDHPQPRPPSTSSIV